MSGKGQGCVNILGSHIVFALDFFKSHAACWVANGSFWLQDAAKFGGCGGRQDWKAVKGIITT
jgi:hypothetical protein